MKIDSKYLVVKMKTSRYQDLIVWQKSIDVTVEIYKLIKLLPTEEKYVISDQMRRAAISIPSNIAEGQSRKNTKEFAHFLNIAKGSKSELETQLYICCKVGLLKSEQCQKALDLCDEIGGMLAILIDKSSKTNSDN